MSLTCFFLAFGREKHFGIELAASELCRRRHLGRHWSLQARNGLQHGWGVRARHRRRPRTSIYFVLFSSPCARLTLSKHLNAHIKGGALELNVQDINRITDWVTSLNLPPAPLYVSPTTANTFSQTDLVMILGLKAMTLTLNVDKSQTHKSVGIRLTDMACKTSAETNTLAGSIWQIAVQLDSLDALTLSLPSIKLYLPWEAVDCGFGEITFDLTKNKYSDVLHLVDGLSQSLAPASTAPAVTRLSDQVPKLICFFSSTKKPSSLAETKRDN